MNPTAASLSLSLASFRTQALDSLLSSASADDSRFGDILAALQPGGGTAPATSAGGATSASGLDALLSPGRNMALRDPESAFTMMTEINRRDVTYKAQFAELSEMQADLTHMQQAAQALSQQATPDASGLLGGWQEFARQYNAWVADVQPDISSGGVLDGTQAAEVAVWELEQSVTYPFIGAKDGLRGLADMGITIDPHTRNMSIDESRFSAALSRNPQGVMGASAEFSGNFAKSASLLVSDGNFVPRQLDNLKRAIHYIDGNIADWRQEFGSGDAARPSAQVTEALAAYGKVAGL